MPDEKLSIVLSLFGIGFSALAVIVALGEGGTAQTVRARPRRIKK